MAPVAAPSQINPAPARPPILTPSLLNNTSLLRVIVASPRSRPRDTSGNRLHPVLKRTNVGGEPDVTRTSPKCSELANSDIRVVRRALFIFLLFDEIAAVDRSRLGNGQYSKNKWDNAAV